MTAVAGDGVCTSAILAGVGVGWLGLMLAARAVVERRARSLQQGSEDEEGGVRSARRAQERASTR